MRVGYNYGPDKLHYIPPIPVFEKLLCPRGFWYNPDMIRKTTSAAFKDGDYKGVYDWSGGIPLAVGETVTVIRNSHKYVYKLAGKETTLEDFGEDQSVKTEYYLELAR
jgi:hypothetical protein